MGFYEHESLWEPSLNSFHADTLIQNVYNFSNVLRMTPNQCIAFPPQREASIQGLLEASSQEHTFEVAAYCSTYTNYCQRELPIAIKLNNEAFI